MTTTTEDFTAAPPARREALGHPADMPTETRLELTNVRAKYPDASRLHLEERELSLALPRSDHLGLDTEYNYVIVGIHWCVLPDALVMLPSEISRCEDPDGSEVWDLDYDRVAHIDRAIEALQRAKALHERRLA